MIYSGKTFTISYQNSPVTVEVYTIDKREVMKVLLPSPFFITKAKDKDNYSFWTSLPQGKQQLATEIGELIDSKSAENINKNNSTQTSLF